MGKVDVNALRDRRIEMDITLKDVSERTKIPVDKLRRIELGQEQVLDAEIEKLCEALDLCVSTVYSPEFKNTVIISLINNKGGCGKTSVCASIGYAMAEMGYRILLIDSDSQRNLTTSYNMGKSQRHFGVAVINEEDISSYIVPTGYENIDMVVADVSMGTLDMMLFTKMQRESIVKEILLPVKNRGIYDFILIDTNPNLSLLNFNIINASDACIIPVQPAGFDVDGIVTVIDFINGVQRFNPELQILGIVVNRYDARNKTISEAALTELRESYGHLLFDTVIKVDVKIQNAQWENRQVFEYAPSRIAREYRALAQEVVEKCRR